MFFFVVFFVFLFDEYYFDQFLFRATWYIYELGQSISYKIACAPSEDSDQMCRLI